MALIFVSNGQTYTQSVNSGDQVYVESGGVATGDIAGGGEEYVFGGGLASGVVVQDGGYLDISGTADGTTVDGGGLVDIAYKGVASGSLIADGGVVRGALSATTVNDTIEAGGSEIIVEGVASGAVVQAGGYLVISSLGSAFEPIVEAGGTLVQFPGTTVIGATGAVQTGGEVVLSTGVVTATTAPLSGNTLSPGEDEYVLSGGIAESPALLPMTSNTLGGRIFVYADGLLSGGVDDGQAQLVSGGAASGVVVGSGGSIYDEGGSDASTMVLAGGALFVVSGYIQGVSTSASVASGGLAEASAFGLAVDPTVGSGGTVLLGLDGVASGGTVSSGGFLVVSSGGSLYGAQVEAGGLVIVPTSGVVSGVGGAGTIQYGGVVVSSGYEVISAAPAISGNALTGSGFYVDYLEATEAEYVYNGGVASGARVDSGGGLYVSSGGVANGDLVGSGGAELVANGGVATADTISDEGSSYIQAGGSAVDATLIGGGFELISAGGVAGGAMVGNGGTQVVDGLATSTSVLSGGLQALNVSAGVTDLVAPGGEIFFPIAYQAAFSAGVASGDVLELLSGGVVLDSVQLLPGSDQTYDVSSGGYTLAYYPQAGTVLEGAACYLRGTRVATPDGETPIEDLRVGDEVLTAFGAPRAIRWIGARAYRGRFARRNAAVVMPVRIRAGALADGVPSRDLFVSPRHAVLIDGLLIPAECLINGATVARVDDCDVVEYFHLDLGSHDVILAEGAASESFVDDDSRMLFHNAADYAARYPDATPVPAFYCAPRVSDGDALEAIRRRLGARAALRVGEGNPPRGLVDEIRFGAARGRFIEETSRARELP